MSVQRYISRCSAAAALCAAAYLSAAVAHADTPGTGPWEPPPDVTGKSLKSLVALFIDYVNLFIPLLIGAALVIFFIGIIKYIASSGATVGKVKGREFLMWGLIALFVMVSIAGILQLLKDSLRLTE